MRNDVTSYALCLMGGATLMLLVLFLGQRERLADLESRTHRHDGDEAPVLWVPSFEEEAE